MQVVDVNFVSDGIPAEFVCSAVHMSVCQPHRETKRVMFTSVAALCRWCAAKLAVPDNDCFVEQPARIRKLLSGFPGMSAGPRSPPLRQPSWVSNANLLADLPLTAE